MPYMNDPRENAIDVDNGIIWEEDNRIEDRYWWSAKATDLCDMTPEEYMKNPIVEAIEGGGGGGTTTKAPTPPGPTPSGDVFTFYYGWVNRNVPVSGVTISDLTEKEAEVDNSFELDMLLGSPTQEDLDYIEQYVGTAQWQEAMEEVRDKRTNTYYFIVPDEYNSNDRMSIEEGGNKLPDETIFRGFEIEGTPSGYSAFKIDNVDNYMPKETVDEPDSYVTYKIEFLSE